SCGACGVACDSTTGKPSCNGSTCSYACNAGLGDCNAATAPDTDGCETSLTTNTNCGVCGNTCSKNTSCTAHSNGLGQSYYDCFKTGTYDVTTATDACTSANLGACSAATATCGSGSTAMAISAVC